MHGQVRGCLFVRKYLLAADYPVTSTPVAAMSGLRDGKVDSRVGGQVGSCCMHFSTGHTS